jgi:Flp pilus assembly protein TadG
MKNRQSWTRRLLSPLIRRSHTLAKDEKGAVAVEFALLAIPFFSLVLAILETAIMFFAQQILESALQDSTRFVRTGQSQATWDIDEMRMAICSRTYGMFDCSATDATTERLLVVVEPVSDFDAAVAALGMPIDEDCQDLFAPPEDCEWTLTEAFDDGAGSDVIIAQAFYKWPVILNVPWFNLATQAGNNRLLSAARVFKNEPF